MKPTHFTLSLLLLFPAATIACGDAAQDQSDVESVEVADASFALDSMNDCVEAFSSRAFLVALAREKGWGPSDIETLCEQIDEVASTYEDNATLTVVTVAGALLNAGGETLNGGVFVGAAAYDLNAIRDWLGEVRAARGVARCIRRAGLLLRAGQPLPRAFGRTCLEDETGTPYPAPIFSERRSSLASQPSTGPAAAAGLGATILLYNVPGRGTVVSFIAGTFYGQTSPEYYAFLGCGVVAGFEQVSETRRSGTEFICMGAEY